MKLTQTWWSLFESLHALVQEDLAHCESNNRKMNWSHYGRCLSSLLNNPIGIAEYHPWRVCGVTPDALNQIMKNKSNKGIQRGHIVSQLDIAKLLLSPSQLHSKQLFEQVLSTFDVTVLMTTEQNNRMTKDATIPFEYIEIHNPISELFTAQYRGYRFRKGYELSRLHEINNAPRNSRQLISSEILVEDFSSLQGKFRLKG